MRCTVGYCENNTPRPNATIRNIINRPVSIPKTYPMVFRKPKAAPLAAILNVAGPGVPYSAATKSRKVKKGSTITEER